MTSGPLRELAQVLEKTDPTANPGAALRYGVVQAVTAPTLTIRLNGSTTDITGVRKLASYTTAAASDVVAVLIQGANLLVIGEVG